MAPQIGHLDVGLVCAPGVFPHAWVGLTTRANLANRSVGTAVMGMTRIATDDSMSFSWNPKPRVVSVVVLRLGVWSASMDRRPIPAHRVLLSRTRPVMGSMTIVMGEPTKGLQPRPRPVGSGVCRAAGTTTCIDGRPVEECIPGQPQGPDATCDGVDDDCDGRVDEACAPEAILCGAGVRSARRHPLYQRCCPAGL